MQSIQSKLKKIINPGNLDFDWKNDEMRCSVGVLLIIFAVTFLYLANNPLCFFRNAPLGGDSSVFITVAAVMKNGGMPYLDTFDHKGPLLYIINYTGLKLCDYKGI